MINLIEFQKDIKHLNPIPMKYYTDIPQNFERAEELSNLIDTILNVITIDSAFLSREQIEGDSTYHILTLFTDVDNDPIPNEILELVSKLGKEYPDFRIGIFTEEQSEIGLSRGSLYFLEHCCLGHTVYLRSEGANLLDYAEMTLSGLYKRASHHYASEMKKATTFFKTADILIKEGNYEIAAFNMHQAFELAFRLVERLGMGRNKVTHSIIGHINFCKGFFPNLHPFPKTSKLDNNELLILLEHAYSAVRSDNEYKIEKGQVQMIQSEFQSFIQQIEDTFNRHLENCRERIYGEDKEDSVQSIKEDENGSEEIATALNENQSVDKILHKTVKLIKKRMDPTHIYLIEKRTFQTQDENHFLEEDYDTIGSIHYWIFVVSKKENIDSIQALIDSIQQKFPQASLCICTETPKKFSKKLNKGNPFYYQVVREGKLLFQAEGAFEFVAKDDFSTMWSNKTSQIICSRYGRARDYLLMAETPMDNPLMSIHLVSLAVEQVCLGMIFGILNYRPKNCSFSHLIGLCSFLYPYIHNYFPTNTDFDKSMFELLRNARSQMLIQNRDIEIEEFKEEILFHRFKEFMTNSRELIYMAQ